MTHDIRTLLESIAADIMTAAGDPVQIATLTDSELIDYITDTYH